MKVYDDLNITPDTFVKVCMPRVHHGSHRLPRVLTYTGPSPKFIESVQRLRFFWLGKVWDERGMEAFSYYGA